MITSYAAVHTLLPFQIQVRVDGLYGDAAVLSDVLEVGLGFIGRSRDYTLLDRAEVQAVLARPPAEICTHPGKWSRPCSVRLPGHPPHSRRNRAFD